MNSGRSVHRERKKSLNEEKICRFKKKYYLCNRYYWEDRIVAIAADCKSAPSGSVVRVHLFPRFQKSLNIMCWGFFRSLKCVVW